MTGLVVSMPTTNPDISFKTLNDLYFKALEHKNFKIQIQDGTVGALRQTKRRLPLVSVLLTGLRGEHGSLFPYYRELKVRKRLNTPPQQRSVRKEHVKIMGLTKLFSSVFKRSIS